VSPQVRKSYEKELRGNRVFGRRDPNDASQGHEDPG